jgi:hypothetical protein
VTPLLESVLSKVTSASAKSNSAVPEQAEDALKIAV